MRKHFYRNAAVAAVSLLAGASWADKGDAPIKQTAAMAEAADIANLAEREGLNRAQVAKAIAFQEQFTKYAQRLDERYPGQLSRVWLEPAPSTRAFVQFVGKAPEHAVPAGVEVFGHGGLTRAEHAHRAELAADILKANGYTNFYTHFDAALGAIRVEMVIPERAAEPAPSKIAGLIQDELRAAEKDTKNRPLADVDVHLVRRDGPIYTLEWSRGGVWCRDDDERECTSGWAVDGPNGDGIITAAHCSGLDSIGSSRHPMTHRRQERDMGDVEYHTTNGVEIAEFWASSSTLRDVRSTKETIWMLPGTAVCVYGRSSNVRDCNHDIEATGVTATDQDGFTIRKLVRASGDSTIPGDSGGGWSWSTKAWGVHSGSNEVDSFFTPIGRAERELNVDVLLAP